MMGTQRHNVRPKIEAGRVNEQEVEAITHKVTPSVWVGKGKDVEKIVHSRDVLKHIDRKVLAYKNKTVIFN